MGGESVKLKDGIEKEWAEQCWASESDIATMQTMFVDMVQSVVIACSFQYCVLRQAALCVFANLHQERFKVEKSRIVQ